MNNMPNFSIGILSWGSPLTLRNTLQSYRDGGLLSLTEDVTIFFQEVSDRDLAIAEEFGITQVLSSESNIGIGKAFNKLIDNARYENVLILENDWVLCEPAHHVQGVVSGCCFHLANHSYDFIRLRHSKNPGDPLYTRQFAGREMDSPEHLLDANHWLGVKLAEKYPEYVKFYGILAGSSTGFLIDYGFLVAKSFYGNHTNNPFMTTKTFYNKAIAPYAGEGVALEGAIRDAWRSASYYVAHSIPGLFTHYRIDR